MCEHRRTGRPTLQPTPPHCCLTRSTPVA
jgi:hypothetical protein